MTCCDLHGTTQWQFNERVLQGPRGISVDSVGNMYVVGYNSNNVAWLPPQLLSSKDELVLPYVFDYNISTNRLLVVNQSSAALLLGVTRDQ